MVAEPEQEITHGIERAAGGIFAGLARMAESVLGLLFGGGEPKQTPQQAHERAQAAGNVETQHAQAYEAAQREKDERLAELLDQIRRQDAERDLRASQRSGRTATREANINRDRDDDYGRERER